MKDFLLQTQSSDNVQSSLSENISSFVERVNPLQLPHESFVTDLAIIMILAAIVTLAFFKIRQPLIIGYLFAGMIIGPLSPLWTSFLPANGGSSTITGIGILSNTLLLGGLFLLDVFLEKNPLRGGGKGATPEFRQIF